MAEDKYWFHVCRNTLHIRAVEVLRATEKSLTIVEQSGRLRRVIQEDMKLYFRKYEDAAVEALKRANSLVSLLQDKLEEAERTLEDVESRVRSKKLVDINGLVIEEQHMGDVDPTMWVIKSGDGYMPWGYFDEGGPGPKRRAAVVRSLKRAEQRIVEFQERYPEREFELEAFDETKSD